MVARTPTISFVLFVSFVANLPRMVFVLAIAALIASASKFAFVMVMKRLTVTRWLISLSTGLPSLRNAVVTCERHFVS